MLNLSPQGVLFLRLVNIIYEKIEKMAGEDICFVYFKKRVKNGLHLRVTYKRFHKTLITQKILSYSLYFNMYGKRTKK